MDGWPCVSKCSCRKVSSVSKMKSLKPSVVGNIHSGKHPVNLQSVYIAVFENSLYHRRCCSESHLVAGICYERH